MKTNEELIESMIKNGSLQNPKIIEAFKKIDRKYFIPDDLKDLIYIDRPLPIGEDQTISQPSTVAFMLEHLEPKEGDKILDIGSGSGWTTALLCHIAGESGSVQGLERVEQLVKKGKQNLEKFNFNKNCSIQKAGEHLGIPHEKFDKILVSASANEIPKELFSQLKIGGILVIPVKNSIFRFKKLSDEKVEAKEYPGFVFVPLITQR